MTELYYLFGDQVADHSIYEHEQDKGSQPDRDRKIRHGWSFLFTKNNFRSARPLEIMQLNFLDEYSFYRRYKRSLDEKKRQCVWLLT